MWNEGVVGGTVVEGVDGTEGSGTGGGVGLVHSPVPNCEGPGAPSLWSGKVIGTGATRQGSSETVQRQAQPTCFIASSAFQILVMCTIMSSLNSIM